MVVDTSFTKNNAFDGKCLEIENSLSYAEYTNALVLPFLNDKCQLGGVVTAEGIFIGKSGLYEERTVGIYQIEDAFIVEDESVVLYLGLFLYGYGHAITDNLKKLWSLKETGIVYDKIVYIADWVEKKNPCPSYVKRIFELAGLDIDKCSPIEYVTRFKKVIIPDNSFIHHDGYKYIHPSIREIYERMRQNVTCTRSFGDKIYFTRTGLKQHWHRDWGEKSVEKVFRKLGYEILHPETMSVDEQICAMNNCSHFAATEGSVAHNSVFCRPGTNVILIRKVDLFNIWQMAINVIANLNVTYIDAHRSIRTNKQFPMVGPFYMCITPDLERFTGRRFLHLPLWLSPSWYMYKYQIENKRLYQKCIRMLKKVIRL